MDEELTQLRERLRGEVETESETMERTHRENMESMRLEGVEELGRMREILRNRSEEDMEALQQEKEKEHADVRGRGCVCV